MTIQNILANFLGASTSPLACLLVALGAAWLAYGLVCGCAYLMRKYGKPVSAVLLSVALLFAGHADKSGTGGTNAPPSGAQAAQRSLRVDSQKDGVAALRIVSVDDTSSRRTVNSVLSGSLQSMRQTLRGELAEGPVVEPFAVRPVNATENAWWRARGAYVDGLTIPALGWSFRTPAGFLDSLLVYSYGEIQPDVETTYFPRPFPEADLSLLPEGKWGMLPHEGEESLFWHATSPTNSLILTWQNAAYDRDANCPTNLQVELFSNGTYVYRYPDRTEHHAVEYPFDLDGDGLENLVDPDPLTPGNDAHGTNAEWYDLVCSDVFSKNEQADSLSVSLPSGESVFFTPNVNTNAYYFVDVVAQKGPAPIRFNSSHLGRLGSPVVVALAGETNRVPLLIGATYSVTSDVPFTVSCPTNGFAEVSWSDGLNATVRWPMDFTFTENFTSSGRTMTINVGPFDPGGVFEWGSVSDGLVGGGVPSTGMDVCNCIQGTGNVAVVGCSSDCSCGGHCQVVGGYRVETVLFPFVCTCCTCGWMSAPAVENVEGPVDANVTVTFDTPFAIMAPSGDVDPSGNRRSTEITLTVTVCGGATGGEMQIETVNLEESLMKTQGPVLPTWRVKVPASSRLVYQITYVGRNESSRFEDIAVSATLRTNGEGLTKFDDAKATCCSIRFAVPSGDPVLTPGSEGVIGRNEFTYDDATSSLSMNLRVSVMPSLDMVTASHMLGQFVLPSIEGVTILWDDGGSGNVSAQSFDSPFGLDGEDERLTLFSTRAVYQGYPLHNSGFGRKTVSFTCRGMTISQDFEIFFPKMGHNHPTCSTCPNCPNWFYYWREGDVCHIPSDAVWAEATGAHLGALGWLDASGVLFLTNLAADDEEQLRVAADYEMTNVVFH